MKKVEIYVKGYCPYCKKAVAILKKTGVDFEQFDVTDDEDTYNVAKAKSGCQTVPQIFIDDVFIGGCDDLTALKTSGELNEILDI